METTCTDNMAETIAASAAQLKERIDYHNKLIAAAFGAEDIDDTTNDSGAMDSPALSTNVLYPVFGK